jgi:hypothetical protein
VRRDAWPRADTCSGDAGELGALDQAVEACGDFASALGARAEEPNPDGRGGCDASVQRKRSHDDSDGNSLVSHYGRETVGAAMARAELLERISTHARDPVIDLSTRGAICANPWIEAADLGSFDDFGFLLTSIGFLVSTGFLGKANGCRYVRMAYALLRFRAC